MTNILLTPALVVASVTVKTVRAIKRAVVLVREVVHHPKD
jgi:hypothetical protein